MTTNHFIAAIELSSSTIAGIAGRKNDDGSLHVLAYAHEDSSAFVRRGAIYNIDKAANAVKSIVGKLEAQLPASIAKIYVGIGGQSLRTVKNLVGRTLAEEGIISQELVDSLTDENLSQPVTDMSILDVVPQEYKIGNNLTIDPVGVYGKDITGQFLNIVARNSLKKNLELSFSQAKVEIADCIVTPMVLAKAVLTDSEMNAGCALVDIGAETTTVQVYQKNLLRYLSVLPLGGNNITRDITTLQMEEEEAEEVKQQYGDALYEEDGNGNAPLTCTLKDGRNVELRVLNDIVGARMEEILANAWNQIQLSGYEGKLFSGIVLTGGAAALKNTEAALRKRSKVEKIRTARRVQCFVDGADNEHYRNALLGLLMEGNENCAKELPQPQKPVEDPVLFTDEEMEKGKEPQPGNDTQQNNDEDKKGPDGNTPKGPKKKGWGIGKLFDKVQNEFLNTNDNSSEMK